MSRFLISAPSRVHVNLLSLSDVGYRSNGGLGFAISDFDIVIECFAHDDVLIQDLRGYGIDGDTMHQLRELLLSIIKGLGLKVGVSIKILAGPASHSGLGTGTTLRLSFIESLLTVNAYAFTDQELVELSKRGGTSGVGINTYFNGGFILDVGVKNIGASSVPSSSFYERKIVPPRVLISSDMPAWEIGIVTFQGGGSLSGENEKNFFAKHTPLPIQDVHEATYHAFMGVAASLVENDLEAFAVSVSHIQKCSWKAAEWSVQPEVVLNVRKELVTLGASAVGLSSFGPTLYVLGVDLQRVKSVFDLEGVEFTLVLPCNRGRLLRYV